MIPIFNNEITLKHTYTLKEACDYMRNLDRFPTARSISWVNTRTGEPVTIGYNDNYM